MKVNFESQPEEDLRRKERERECAKVNTIPVGEV